MTKVHIGEGNNPHPMYSNEYGIFTNKQHNLGGNIMITEKNKRTVYVTVKMVITNTDNTPISDDDIDYVISETDYDFKDVDNFKIETEITDYEA